MVIVTENSGQLQQQSQDVKSGGGKSPEKAGSSEEVLTRLFPQGNLGLLKPHWVPTHFPSLVDHLLC